MYRILKPGAGRMLFSDALVIGGVISHDEIAARSSIGFYLFSPPGENERLIRSAGFSDIKVVDTTENAAGSQRGGARRGKTTKTGWWPRKAYLNGKDCSDSFLAYSH